MTRGRGLSWSKADLTKLKRLYGTKSHDELAMIFGRTRSAINSTLKNHGISKDRSYTDHEVEFIREWYGYVSAKFIAHAICRSLPGIYRIALKIGVGERIGSFEERFGEKFQQFLREKHALGWSDDEIAKAWGHRCERHTIGEYRQRMGLPINRFSEHQRKRVAAKTQEQCQIAGVSNLGQLRGKVLMERSERYGWPSGIRWRGVQMLNALYEQGPMTRRQLAEAIGMPWKGSRASLHSNDPEGSYLATLIALGLVICMKRKLQVGGQGQNVSLYMLNPMVERGPIDPELLKGTDDAQSTTAPGDQPDQRVAAQDAHGDVRRHHRSRHDGNDENTGHQGQGRRHGSDENGVRLRRRRRKTSRHQQHASRERSADGQRRVRRSARIKRKAGSVATSC